jgi:hypothetical protein
MRAAGKSGEKRSDEREIVELLVVGDGRVGSEEMA